MRTGNRAALYSWRKADCATKNGACTFICCRKKRLKVSKNRLAGSSLPTGRRIASGWSVSGTYGRNNARNSASSWESISRTCSKITTILARCPYKAMYKRKPPPPSTPKGPFSPPPPPQGGPLGGGPRGGPPTPPRGPPPPKGAPWGGLKGPLGGASAGGGRGALCIWAKK